MLHRLVDNRNPASLAARMRQKRFALFRSLIASLPRPIHILDVGGTYKFWDTMGFVDPQDVRVVLLNIAPMPVDASNFESVVGDACNMSLFRNNEFDIVFSNSVIEHVGTYSAQRKMAEEVKRVGKRYFVQTPNRYFPLEPHFLFPLYQFLPVSVRVLLIRHFNLGWYKKIPDAREAQAFVESHTLLSEQEFQELFKEAVLYKEKVAGMTKSFVVYDGF